MSIAIYAMHGKQNAKHDNPIFPWVQPMAIYIQSFQD
jgi:hypothetical protein